jgi:mannose-6-phosphate isomerase
MLLPLTNTPRDYAWGSTTAIAELLGAVPSGKPEAELWLGAHPGSPALVHDGPPVALDEWIAADPKRALSGGTKLPFLLKLLAARKPLSLQAHPSRAQARAGYARENALGVPLDSPLRNYRDDEHKPELIVAISEEFIALSGFRPLAQSVHDLQAISDARPSLAAAEFVDELRARATGGAPAALAWAVEYLLRGGDRVELIIREFAQAAVTDQALSVAPSATLTMRSLAAEYPTDPGIVIGALLNRVVLDPGEALYLPAGNLHAYLSGLGVELMSASDNVLRGGLTSKHVDVDELLRVADFEPLLEPRLASQAFGEHLSAFVAPIDDFLLVRYQNDRADEVASAESATHVPVTCAAIALCTAGEAVLSGAHSTLTLKRGQACFVTGDETSLNISGTADVFIATSRG